jgi:hypothetical protein
LVNYATLRKTKPGGLPYSKTFMVYLGSPLGEVSPRNASSKCS